MARANRGFDDSKTMPGQRYACPRCLLEFESQIDYIEHLADNYNATPIPARDSQLKFYERDYNLRDWEKRAIEYTGSRSPSTRPLRVSPIEEEVKKGLTAKKKGSGIASKLLAMAVAEV